MRIGLEDLNQSVMLPTERIGRHIQKEWAAIIISDNICSEYRVRIILRLLPNPVKQRENHGIPPVMREYAISNRNPCTSTSTNIT